MPAKERAHHTRIPLVEVPPQQQAWIDWASELCEAFSAAVHSGDDELGAFDSFVIQTAADLIWADSEGAPSWSALDVDDYLRRHAQSPFWSGQQQAYTVITLISFYEWLVAGGHVECSEGLLLLRKLEAHVNADLTAAGYVPQYRVAADEGAIPN